LSIFVIALNALHAVILATSVDPDLDYLDEILNFTDEKAGVIPRSFMGQEAGLQRLHAESGIWASGFF
jgi:hypothetical protein